MDRPHKVYVFFERSGTFKNAFEKMGIPATDYDLEMEHEEVVSLDLFEEIRLADRTDCPTVFDEITPDDLILAFFPCTYFSDQSQLVCRCDLPQVQDYPLEKKLALARTNMKFRYEYFDTLCALCSVCLKRNLRLVIENPLGKVNFLKWFFPMHPELIIPDRTQWGDVLKKATQFFFINCHAGFCLENHRAEEKETVAIEKIHGFERSRITPQFAENFIKKFIL